jgi:phosphoribosylformylglycinamidine synthase I
MRPPVLILHANGTNRDLEVARAFELAGGAPEVVHLNQLRAQRRRWADYAILVLPGGFSYGDTLGAGQLLAVDLRMYFADEMRRFIESGKPVLGICNGFQALVKAGLLPFGEEKQTTATLTFNAQGRFECRWVTLAPESQTCLWTRGLSERIECPVAHGEGNFVLRDSAILETLWLQDQIALRYVLPNGSPAQETYPFNPNGSVADIAGICNPKGNVLGLMPHPEDHVLPYQHPQMTRRRSSAGGCGGLGLALFENGVAYASQM